MFFIGCGFRKETSRHSTPNTSATTSRANTPTRIQRNSLSWTDNMDIATMYVPLYSLKNVVKHNIEEVRELSEMNRIKHKAKAEEKRANKKDVPLKEMGLINKNIKSDAVKNVSSSKANSSNEFQLLSSSSLSMTPIVTARTDLRHSGDVAINDKEFISDGNALPKPLINSFTTSQLQSLGTLTKHSMVSKRQRSISLKRYAKTDNNIIKPMRHNTPKKSPSTDESSIPSKFFLNLPKKVEKTVDSAPASSGFCSRQTMKISSSEPIPNKTIIASKPHTKKIINSRNFTTQVSRTMKPREPSLVKTKSRKPINIFNNMKPLVRALDTNSLNEKLPVIKIKKCIKYSTTQPSTRTNESRVQGTVNKSKTFEKNTDDDIKKSRDRTANKKTEVAKENTSYISSVNIQKQGNETQYDGVKNEKEELVIISTNDNVFITTSTISSQPLGVVTTIADHLPTAFEKDKGKGMHEINSFKRPYNRDEIDNADLVSYQAPNEKNEKKSKAIKTFEDNVKLKPMFPPYNNPQVARVRQKIDDILTATLDASSENVISSALKLSKNVKYAFKNLAHPTKILIPEAQNATEKKNCVAQDLMEQDIKMAAEISGAGKIDDPYTAHFEDSDNVTETDKAKIKMESKVMIVNEKTSSNPEIIEEMRTTLEKREPEIEVQNSYLCIIGPERNSIITGHNKTGGGNESDKSMQSNGRFLLSTSSTFKSTVRAHRKYLAKDSRYVSNDTTHKLDKEKVERSICSRLMVKCKIKCCSCCLKTEDDSDIEKTSTQDSVAKVERQSGVLSKLICGRKNIKDITLGIEVDEKNNKAIRKRLDPSLVEHTSVMRGSIPVLPLASAYFCLVCNILIPGLGTIFSGLFCLCFGIPRFSMHDGAKHRMELYQNHTLCWTDHFTPVHTIYK